MRRFFCIISILCLACCSLLRAQSYQVGDVVINENDGTKGVVFWLSPDESYGWMVALHDETGIHAWGKKGQNTSVPDFFHVSGGSLYLQGQKDTAGYSNTRTLIQEVGNSSPIFAAKTVDIENGWYLPASGQLSLLNSVMPFIADAIVQEGGELMTQIFYWSSTECTTDEAWCVIQVSGMLSLFEKDYTRTYVRAVRTFQNKHLDPNAALQKRWNTTDTTSKISVKPNQTKSYAVVATNAYGCQGSASKSILVGAAAKEEIFDTLCQGQNYANNGFILPKEKIANPGDYRFDTLIGSNTNCPTKVNLALHVKAHATKTIDTIFCKGKTFGFNGKIYTDPGQYTHHFSAINHCDSTLVLRLAEVQGSHKDIFKTDTNRSFWIDQYYYSSGEYTRTYLSQNGCDSTETLHLTLVEYYAPDLLDSIYDTLVICAADLPYTYFGKTFDAAGSYSFYTDEVTLLFLELIVNVASSHTVVQDACQEFTYQGATYTRDTSFVQTLVNANGCDSLLTLVVRIHPNDTLTVVMDSIGQISYQGVTYTHDTVLYEYYASQWGCDSVIVIRLLVRENLVECDIVVYWGKVLALANPQHHDFLTTASYQWFRNGSVLPGNRDYIEVGKPIPEGEYQVNVRWEGGTLTRKRTFKKAKAISLSPNPLKMSDELAIHATKPSILSVEVFDSKGQKQNLKIREQPNHWRISGWNSPGLYLLHISFSDQSADIHKIIVKP